ncbi:MAG: MBL fold metallo-hydrolase [Dysgonamonadaceae bacterium]|jgi:glyoxylase-like metal-dependent hydrolase (beta-lactamase superfamily II)|nr:MBL fold metallo-hydrolase [Dysgonamonadaceae bacterium]
MFQIKTFIFNPIRVNTYILYDETKEAAIVDCGAYSDKEKQRLHDFITENSLTVKLVLNTHLHFDHILGNQFLFNTFGLKPMYGEADEKMPGLGSGGMFLPIKTTHVYAEKYICDGDEIRFGNSILKALATPGHSPGSISFYSEENNCVFTGDALFHHSIGRTDLWEGNFTELVNSIKTRLLTLPDRTAVFPGHEEQTSIYEEKQGNPYLQTVTIQ